MSTCCASQLTVNTLIHSQRLNYSANQCVFPQPRTDTSPNLILLLASELSAREVLQATGFCGDLTRLPNDARAGQVTVDVQLALQLPTQLRGASLAQRGTLHWWTHA